MVGLQIDKIFLQAKKALIENKDLSITKIDEKTVINLYRDNGKDDPYDPDGWEDLYSLLIKEQEDGVIISELHIEECGDLCSDSTDCNPLYPYTISEPLMEVLGAVEIGFVITTLYTFPLDADYMREEEQKLLIKLSNSRIIEINEHHEARIYKQGKYSESISIFGDKTKDELTEIGNVKEWVVLDFKSYLKLANKYLSFTEEELGNLEKINFSVPLA